MVEKGCRGAVEASVEFPEVEGAGGEGEEVMMMMMGGFAVGGVFYGEGGLVI